MPKSKDCTCILARGGDGDFNCEIPSILSAQVAPGDSACGKSVMGYKVTINANGQKTSTVPANKCKPDPKRPGWMEVIIRGKKHSVHKSNVIPMNVPIVYFVVIENNTRVIPARSVRRDTHSPEEYVLVTFKGREHKIPISDCNLMDGTPMQPGDVPDDDSPIYRGISPRNQPNQTKPKQTTPNQTTPKQATLNRTTPNRTPPNRLHNVVPNSKGGHSNRKTPELPEQCSRFCKCTH